MYYMRVKLEYFNSLFKMVYIPAEVAHSFCLLFHLLLVSAMYISPLLFGVELNH